jgi:hypothetical protein
VAPTRKKRKKRRRKVRGLLVAGAGTLRRKFGVTLKGGLLP